MSKAVLISIQPYWVFLIIAKLMGWNHPEEKTIEVRKNFPSDEEWNRVVEIYCSKDKKSFNQIPKEYQPLMKELLGKVIGKFVCDYILGHCESSNADIAEQRGCVKREKLFEYANGKELHAWHISDLVIYDKPRELGEFRKPCDKDYDCFLCDKSGYAPDMLISCFNLLTRPPQSWCYIENVKEDVE